MNNLEVHIKQVNDKLQQLLKNHLALKKENQNLQQQVKELKQKEEGYKTSLHELEQKVSILKAASGEMTGADKRAFESKVNQYIKEIDRCI